jgi:hypothetical protein
MICKKIQSLFLLLNIFGTCSCYFDICIVGASSGLGKELVYQSLHDKNLRVLATTSNLDGVKIPFRGGGLNDNLDSPIIVNNNLRIDNYWKDINYIYDYKNIVFTTNSGPFKDDYSYFLTTKFLDNLSLDCKSISLVSAYGVGDSLEGANAGIKIMENFYLKKVYEAKNKQEKIIKQYKRNMDNIKNPYYLKKILRQNKNIKKNIYRPKVLTYGENIFNGLSREDLAKTILANMIF